MAANNLRANFAPCHTYSFLPFRSKRDRCKTKVLRRSRFLHKRAKETEDLWKTGHKSLGFCIAKRALASEPAPNVEK